MQTKPRQKRQEGHFEDGQHEREDLTTWKWKDWRTYGLLPPERAPRLRTGPAEALLLLPGRLMRSRREAMIKVREERGRRWLMVVVGE